MLKRIIPYGERAILIEFEQKVDAEINQLVHHWNIVIQQLALPGFSYTIPAYASLTIVFQNKVQKIEQLITRLSTIAEQKTSNSSQVSSLIEVPVCYDPKFALDQELIMEASGLSWQEVVALHTKTEYLVYMLGFTPGFSFMGKLPPPLQMKRRQTPRLKVPAGSVGLANAQTGIYPEEIPGGWQIIGRTPWKPFDPNKENPFLFQAGDRIRFYAIDEASFKSMSQ